MTDRFYNIDEQRRWNEDYMWEDNGHEWSKVFGSTENLWNKTIFPYVKKFRNTPILEIAPGRGRITQFLSVLASELTVVDLNESCINSTKEKLGEHVKTYIVNDGKTLTNVGNESQSLVISWDSFVHMHKNVIEDYIQEIQRVLVKGGMCYIHHSWFFEGSEYSTRNLAGRSNMDPELFKTLVEKHGMKIINQFPVEFKQVHDFVTIFEK
jgi:2-polyprenyl-3-methyl-5-hydroxy-6-metoxy-1,4-benzoquinol methylase